MRKRSEVPPQERWNVEALYPNTGIWKKDFEEMKKLYPEVKNFIGKLGEPENAEPFFQLYFSIDRKISKLYTYAHLRLDEDVSNDSSKEHFGLITALYHDFQLACSWVEPELLSLSEEEYKALSRLKDYRFFLEKLLRMRPHTLTKELEEILALSGKALDVPSKAFGALNNADLTFESAVTATGEKKELTTGTYFLYARDKDRVLRESSFSNLHRGYEAHANTLCELIQGQAQSHLFIAKARKFKDCRQASLFARNVDGSVYDNLIKAVRGHLEPLRDYLQFRKELLNLDQLHPYDLHIPLIEEVSFHCEFKEACQLVIESVAPLGNKYQEVVRKGLLEDRWVDPIENEKKRSGGYSSGCFDSMPYILMNYHGTLNDVLTLAHEVGHSMHSYLSRKNQPYHYADYPIFVAEVASTFNEQLLLKLLKEKAKSKKELAWLVNYEIEAIRTTIIRQTLLAEFELQVHRAVEQGIPLTPKWLKEAYLQLNRDYYGEGLCLDVGLEIEWARIPHFYYNFYVYQYATGLSASLSLFEQVMASHEARDRYIQFLSSGGSKYPIDLLKIAGVDLNTAAPIEAAMKRFSKLLAEFRLAVNLVLG